MSEFLAEARVLIRPDTTGFRALLETELTAATRGVTVPVSVIPTTAGTGATAATQRAVQESIAGTVVAQERLAAESVKAEVAAQRLTTAQRLQAKTTEQLAFAQLEVATASSSVSQAQIQATRSAAALTTAQEGVTAALLTQDAAVIKDARDLLALAQSQNAAAVSALRLARAQAEASAVQGRATQGAIAQGAALAGLRGSVIGANAAFIAGTAAVLGFTAAVRSAVSLDTQLRTFAVTVGATAEELAEVREEAKALGRDITLPGVSATDAAQALLTLARAGLEVRDAIAGTRGVLQLATAAEIENAEAARITASALNAFQLSGNQAVAVADLLTNAANASQASINEMGIALRQSAAIADLAGFSLSETVTFLTQLARAGLVGSDAGTSFRVSIQRLIAPTDKARKVLAELNIELRDQFGNLRPEAFFELGRALEAMGDAQGDAARQTIFGNDASRAAAFFARISADAFRDNEKALERSGAAAEVAGARTEGLAGKTENLKNQLAALGIELGELSIPAVSVAVDVLAGTFELLGQQVADSRKAVGGFADDAEKLQDFFTSASRDSGFTDFLRDVSSGAELVVGDIGRASDATDEFFASLAGAEGAGQGVARSIRVLTEEEKRLAAALTDAHDRVDLQKSDLEQLGTAAQQAAGQIARLTGQISGIQEQVTRARIAGDEGAEFDLLQQERERLQRLLAIQEDIVAQGGTGAATARRRIREQILPQLESVNNEIRAITQEQVRATEDLAREAERARDERDKNILAALGREESRRQNAVVAAEATEAIKDDLKANIALRNFYRRSIEEIRRTVQDAQARSAAISTATADLIRAQAEVDASREELRQALRDERREQRERQRERLDLAVQIAQATGNRAAEIRARENEIDQIKEDIRQTRSGSLQRKRLILELRQAQRDLRELQKETQKTGEEGQSFRELTFSFLQQQQGFAANLLGNLIPGGATGGLVGNISPAGGLAAPGITPGAAVQQEAAVAAGRDLGFSRGQGNETITVLRQILASINALNGRAAAPEARYQRAQQSAFMDVIGT